jgi:hypothetical protein
MVTTMDTDELLVECSCGHKAYVPATPWSKRVDGRLYHTVRGAGTEIELVCSFCERGLARWPTGQPDASKWITTLLVKLETRTTKPEKFDRQDEIQQHLEQRKTVYRICKALLSVPHSLVADAVAYAKAEEIVEAEDSVFSGNDY